MGRKRQFRAKLDQRIVVMFTNGQVSQMETALHYLSIKTGVLPTLSDYIRSCVLGRTNKLIEDYRKHRKMLELTDSE